MTLTSAYSPKQYAFRHKWRKSFGSCFLFQELWEQKCWWEKQPGYLVQVFSLDTKWGGLASRRPWCHPEAGWIWRMCKGPYCHDGPDLHDLVDHERNRCTCPGNYIHIPTKVSNPLHEALSDGESWWRYSLSLGLSVLLSFRVLIFRVDPWVSAPPEQSSGRQQTCGIPVPSVLNEPGDWMQNRILLIWQDISPTSSLQQASGTRNTTTWPQSELSPSET